MNRNFAKLEENNRIIYAPDWVVRVDHHHDEWYEPVYDEDGNPVIDPEPGKQKTEHKTQDWDTERRELHPTADDYANAKDGPWLPLDNTKPEKDGAYFVLFRPPFRRPFATYKPSSKQKSLILLADLDFPASNNTYILA